jgi:hypothetical protein
MAGFKVTTEVPISEVAAILGNSPRIVEKNYSHSCQAKAEALDAAVKGRWTEVR